MATRYTDYLSEVQLEIAKSFDAGFNANITKWQEIFRNDPSQRFEDKFSVRGGMSASFTAVADGASYNQQNPKVVGTQTISQLIFKEAVAITKMMKEKDHYGSAYEDARKLGGLASIKMDQLGANLIAGSTGSTVTWDGLSLANAAHLVGDTGGTQSNRTTGSLITADLETAIQNFGLQQDHNGTVMGLEPKYLVVPRRNMMQAKKLLGSPLTPFDANNSINAITESGLVLVTYSRLVTTDFEAMLLSDQAFHRLEAQLAYGPTLTPDRDPNTGNDLIQLDLAFNVGAVDYLGTYFIV